MRGLQFPQRAKGAAGFTMPGRPLADDARSGLRRL